jgi:shikimate kinase
MKISIIGPMAAGKTTFGKRLAQHLGYAFHDTDQLIEKQRNLSITDIFSLHGELYFRALETEVLKNLLASNDKMIIATGGGVVTLPENCHHLKQHSKVIFLDISIPEQLERTKGDSTRPLLKTPDLTEKLHHLRKMRLPLYHDTASVYLNVEGLSPETVLEKGLAKLSRIR